MEGGKEKQASIALEREKGGEVGNVLRTEKSQTRYRDFIRDLSEGKKSVIERGRGGDWGSRRKREVKNIAGKLLVEDRRVDAGRRKGKHSNTHPLQKKKARKGNWPTFLPKRATLDLEEKS